MATIVEMQTALTELIESDGAISLPGLDFDSVVNNLVEVQLKDELDKIPTVQERKDLKDKFVNYYKNKGRQEVDNRILEIKMNYSAAVTNLKSLQASITTAVASNTMPSVITAGAATSVPNPAYALIENANKKNTLLSICKSIGVFLFNILKAAISICFEIPDMVITLINTLTLTKKSINAIPV